MENTNIESSLDLARVMNYRVHAGQLFIPLLNGLEIQESQYPQSILLATGNGITEQVVSDGYIEESEFQNRIDLAISSTKEYMKNNNCENVDESFFFYKNYSNGIFTYKLYIQDMLMKVDDKKIVTRFINAYFIEPRMKDMYQISLSAGPFEMPVENLILGKIDLENDEITKTLNTLMSIILDNLRYN